MTGKTRIPDGWQLVRLGDVANVNRGVSWSRDQESSKPLNDTVPVVRIGNVQRSGFQLSDTLHIRGISNVGRHRYSVTPRTLVMVGSNGNRDRVGNIFLATPAVVGHLLASFLIKIDPHKDVSAGFLSAVLRSTPLQLAITESTSGSTGLKNLSLKWLRNLRLSIPPLPEQQAIAKVLDSIDEAIEDTEAVIAATKRLRDALLHRLLTRGVPGWHSEWKEVRGLGTIPASWDVVRLGDVAEVKRGKFAHRPRNEPRFFGGSIPFIQTGDVVQANGRIKEHSQTLNELGLSISRLFNAGTIVMTIAANIGETAIASYPVAFPDSLVGITPRKMDARFLEYLLRTQKHRLNRFAPLSAQKNINLEDIRPMLIPNPSSREQRAIAKC